jgi:hypothetical protein
MAADCIEQLVAALDAHPECAVAHCPLRAIDEQGCDVDAINRWWRRNSIFAQSSGSLLEAQHLRTAPFDGLLHLLGGSVYISITQLLIRRSLFDRVGYFEGTWGSVGDFNWCMRAGLAASTVHVPDTWGGWRMRAGQATSGVTFESPQHQLKVEAMIDDAIAAAEALLAPDQRQHLRRLAIEARDLRRFTREVAARRHASAVRRRAFLARRCLSGSASARRYVKDRLLRRSSTDWVRSRLDALGSAPWLQDVRRSGVPDWHSTSSL